MALRTTIREPIANGTTPVFTGDIVDETGALITTFTTLTGTLRNMANGQIINGRENFNLSGACSGGHLWWTASAADTPAATNKPELHRLTLRWTWSSGTKSGVHEIDHYTILSD